MKISYLIKFIKNSHKFLNSLYTKYSSLDKDPKYYQILRALLPNIVRFIEEQKENEFSNTQLSSIISFDRTTLNDYMREHLLPEKIVSIKKVSYSIFPTIYELTKYGLSLVNSSDIFIKDYKGK